MKRMIQSILTELNIQPVLVDIGASFGSPKVWDPIASNSVYVGFDPDLREMHDVPRGKFARSVIVNKAVTSNPDQSAVQFHLTRSPYCSSTLLPDTKSLSNYYFSDMFAVDHTKDVQSISLNAVLKSLSLEHVDWFKTDSQGTDLRLFRSLDNANRSRVLAVDVEPGLVDAYVGEDLFVDTHKSLILEGFWISRMNVLGSIRVRHESLVEQSRSKPELAQGTFGRHVRTSPCWCEARYLRTTEWLLQHAACRREFILLWVFAMIDEQPGFALDVAIAFRRTFGDSKISQILSAEPSHQLMRSIAHSKFSLRGIRNGLAWRLKKLIGREGT